MASKFIEIGMLGDKELARALAKLPDKAQSKAVRPALRKATKRIHVGITQAFSGIPVGMDTGRTLTAIAGVAPIKLKIKHGVVGYGILWPTRDELGISPEDEFFYPAVIEYGSAKDPEHYPARAPVRGTVNRMQGAELGTIGRDVAKGIERQWALLAKKR
jgi:hypothetical protein